MISTRNWGPSPRSVIHSRIELAVGAVEVEGRGGAADVGGRCHGGSPPGELRSGRRRRRRPTTDQPAVGEEMATLSSSVAPPRSITRPTPLLRFPNVRLLYDLGAPAGGRLPVDRRRRPARRSRRRRRPRGRRSGRRRWGPGARRGRPLPTTGCRRGRRARGRRRCVATSSAASTSTTTTMRLEHHARADPAPGRGRRRGRCHRRGAPARGVARVPARRPWAAALAAPAAASASAPVTTVWSPHCVGAHAEQRGAQLVGGGEALVGRRGPGRA